MKPLDQKFLNDQIRNKIHTEDGKEFQGFLRELWKNPFLISRELGHMGMWAMAAMTSCTGAEEIQGTNGRVE